MNKALAFILFFFSLSGVAAEGEKGLSHANVDIFDLQSVRRGAGLFANYCLGCHSIRQMRYSRIAEDLNLDEGTVRQEFMFGDAKIHDNIKTAMNAAAGEASFGVVPPDLSLVVRAKGADWVYSYLKGFYVDPKRPFGVNNIVVENVAMPNVLWDLQGSQEPIMKRVDGEEIAVGVRLVQPGSQSELEFDKTVTDITNFLAYVSEPTRLERLPLGKFAIAFLLVLIVVLFKLKKEYWKEIA